MIARIRSRSSDHPSLTEKKYQTRNSDMTFSLTKLLDERILIQSDPGYFQLSDLGKILHMYSKRDHYNKECKNNLKSIDSEYWELMNTPINYEKTVKAHYLWNDPVS